MLILIWVQTGYKGYQQTTKVCASNLNPYKPSVLFVGHRQTAHTQIRCCYDIKPVRKEEGKSYWKIPLCDDDATREK